MARETGATRQRRRSPLLWVLAGALGVAAAVVVVLLVTGGRTIDPFAYHAAKRAQFEARAAAGESHLLYANSPGGVRATARRVAALHAPIQAAAASAHVDPGLLEAMVFLVIAGLFAGEFHGLHLGAISLRSWLALAYLMVFGSGIGFSAYIYILHQSTATRVATYAFVNPVVALFLGWLLLGETITLRTVIATAVILTAVILVITAPHRTPAPVRDPVPAPGEV